MNKTKFFYAIFGIITIAIVFFALNRKTEEQTAQSGAAASSKSTTKSPSDDYLSALGKGWDKTLETDILYLLEAFENKDDALLRQRVQELLDKDFKKALMVFSELDYTFLHYQMRFPHDLVVAYLQENFTGPESMEFLAPYIKKSSILVSSMVLYFKDWTERDHTGQFEWFKENKTFSEGRTLIGYAETLGTHENGIEVLQLIDGLSSDDYRKQEAQRITMEYLSTGQAENFEAYLETLETLPESSYSPIHNMAINILERESSEDPMERITRATDWINRIENPDLRFNYLSSIASNFAKNHPQEFNQWLQTIEYENEQAKAEFLAEVDEMQKDAVTAAEDSANEQEILDESLTNLFSE